MTDDDLGEIEERLNAASKGPWQPFVEGRDHLGGDNFIRVGGLDDNEPDMYVTRDSSPASVADLDFIAHARQDVEKLLAEVRNLRGR
ncbi:MAG: hypothetical protein RL499_961 [Actinomycetota bacterium]